MTLQTMRRLAQTTAVALIAGAAIAAPALAQDGPIDPQWVEPGPDPSNPSQGNKPEKLEEFRDEGRGLFIHWNVDGTLGGVISHSLVGASEDFTNRYFDELPRQFNPKNFDPVEYAKLARLAGLRYVVFTVKHHAGFAMWDTDTTDFDVEHTPYGKDITRELVDAFRDEGLKIGFYYSPDDFWWLRENNIPINRFVNGVYPQDVPALMDFTKAQMNELLTRYGKIDYWFFDGPAEGLKQYAWSLQPDLVVTRGEIETPEQFTPGVAPDAAWEGNLTMGTEWPWKASNEIYKDGTVLINRLIETRAKGGNLLLNIGPKPDGTIDQEQDGRLREIALWDFVNGEALTAVRPWVVTNEGPVWFTKAKDANTVYAFITGDMEWPHGGEKELVLQSVRATPETEISVLGQNDTVVEYKPKVDPKSRFEQTEDGLKIRVVRAQRLYTDYKWPNPVVVKLTNVEPGVVLPEAETTPFAEADLTADQAILRGAITDIGDAESLEVGFQYRPLDKRVSYTDATGGWKDLPPQTVSAAGPVEATLSELTPGTEYEYRIRVAHPLVETYGDAQRFTASQN